MDMKGINYALHIMHIIVIVPANVYVSGWGRRLRTEFNPARHFVELTNAYWCAIID